MKNGANQYNINYVRIAMYTMDGRVRFSEVNIDNKLDLYGILNYFQDCSIQHSQDVGIGMKYLNSVNRVWLMSAWQLVINRLPEVHENIFVSTWPYDFKSMYGYRNFLLKGDNEEVLAYANSIWVYLDTETKMPTRIMPENISAYERGEPYPMEYAPRKIKIPELLTEMPAFPVIKANLDNNLHVNNCQYVRMAEEYLPEGFRTVQLRADYRKSAVLGDMIVPRVNISGNICTVVLGNEQGDPFVIVEFTS